MPIKVGDRLPNTTFRVMTPDGPKPKTTDEVFKGKKVVLFAVPGAFTPTCDKNHLPGFVKNAEAIKGKGIDSIAVTSVNDPFLFEMHSDPESVPKHLSDVLGAAVAPWLTKSETPPIAVSSAMKRMSVLRMCSSR